jgi:netrin-G3 ligand
MNMRAVDKTATSITLAWEKPIHSGESIISYELYWNHTYSQASLSS